MATDPFTRLLAAAAQRLPGHKPRHRAVNTHHRTGEEPDTAPVVSPAAAHPDGEPRPGPHGELVGGWTVQRLEVIAQEAGICCACGSGGADTAMRRWPTGELRACHTRCALGMQPLPVPPPTHPEHAA